MSDLDAAARGACLRFLEASGIPGLAAALVRGDDFLFLAGLGVASLEHDLPVTADTAFEIASVTKLFTAEAALLLVQDGLIELDTPLADHLELPPGWRGVTVRHALTHQSGIRNYTLPPGYWERIREDRSAEEILALVADLPLDFEPGARYAYDNTGFYLLGLLIEAVTGESYEDHLGRRIFAPLGMTTTRVNDYAVPVRGRASGYSRVNDRIVNKTYYSTSNTFSAGVLLSSARDLATWAASLGVEEGARALRERMWTPQPSREGNERSLHFTVGLGWFLLDFGGRSYAGQNGSLQGFSSTLLHRLDQRLSAVVLYNGDWVEEPHRLALELIGLADSGSPDIRS